MAMSPTLMITIFDIFCFFVGEVKMEIYMALCSLFAPVFDKYCLPSGLFILSRPKRV